MDPWLPDAKRVVTIAVAAIIIPPIILGAMLGALTVLVLF